MFVLSPTAPLLRLLSILQYCVSSHRLLCAVITNDNTATKFSSSVFDLCLVFLIVTHPFPEYISLTPINFAGTHPAKSRSAPCMSNCPPILRGHTTQNPDPPLACPAVLDVLADLRADSSLTHPICLLVTGGWRSPPPCRSEKVLCYCLNRSRAEPAGPLPCLETMRGHSPRRFPGVLREVPR